MKKLKALLFSLSTLCGTNAFATEGAGSSGGGDLFYNKIIRAIPETRATLLTIRPEWMNTVPEVQQFFRDHQKDLVAELDTSPIDLRVENPNGKCAETGFTAKATIFISKTQCGDIEKFTEDMARELLFGEITHHFGKDNKFSAMTAIAVMDAMKTASSYRLPSVTLVGPFIGSYDEAGRGAALQRVKELGKNWSAQIKKDFGKVVTGVRCDEPSLNRYTMMIPTILYSGGHVESVPASYALSDSEANLGFEAYMTCSATGYTDAQLVPVMQELRSPRKAFTPRNAADFIKAYYAGIQDLALLCEKWQKEMLDRYAERIAHLDCVRSQRTILDEDRSAVTKAVTAFAKATAYLLPENDAN